MYWVTSAGKPEHVRELVSRQVNACGSVACERLAFGGTGLCSYCVRGVDGSCAKHLTVECYMVIYAALLPVILIIISFPSLTHSFIPSLKPPFSANPSHRSLSFSGPGLTSQPTRIPQTVYCYF